MKTAKQKKFKMYLCSILSFTILLILLAGCGSRTDVSDSKEGGDPAVGQDVETSIEPGAEFSYSEGLDENGFFAGIRALDYIVQPFNYRALSIPNDVHYVSDEVIQSEIDSMLAGYSTNEEIYDRAIVKGDTVNIDYVGSVDGVEFEGGSTGGRGTNVIAGSLDYIDDFLVQIIGHKPGETINVEVTFPDDYHAEELAGKDALFVTTINYIAGDEIKAELTDEFVAENLSYYGGWTSIADMKAGLRSNIQQYAIQGYVGEYFSNEVTIRSVPEQLLKYQQRSMLSYYENTAGQYGMEFEEYLKEIEGLSGLDELVDRHQDDIMQMAKTVLVVQAVAESENFSISAEDLKSYFLEQFGSDDYSMFEEQYGLPFIKQAVMHSKVMDYIIENAVLA